MKKKSSKNNKIIKLNNNINFGNKISSIKFRILLAIILIICIFLVIRLFYLQFIDGNRLEKLAYTQQSTTEVIAAKRGNIYDSTGIPLAISSTVDSVYVYPSRIEEKQQITIAQGLSEILGLNYDEIMTDILNTSSSRHLIKTIQNEETEKLEEWMSENKITDEVMLEETSKRAYPYNTLASNLIGACGTDNQGLSGIEYSWDSILTGTAGKSVISQDINQSEIPNSEETYIPAENGYNITLTIDVTIQSIVEKYLKQAVEDNKCYKGGTTIAMDPSTGEILAMATYPNYDLNSPFTPNESISENWDTLSASDKNAKIYQMWRNKCVSDTYEPGSVFKVITASIGLEENITETDIKNNFSCTGYEQVADRSIRCWKYYDPHGNLTLRQALCKSCNPAFMQLGRQISASTLYKYFKAYGFFDKTGISLSGEASSIFYDLNDVGPVELATMSFGQRFTITPLQLITAISSIANDGILLQPKIVKQITNADTGEITTINTKEIRQVLSKETAEEVKGLMESVVSIGTGSRAAVKGYSIGGKTGTSEPTSGNKDAGYVASFCAVAPVENTKVVLLVALYDPQGKSHQGGEIAAPVASNMLSEILPHLGIEPTSVNDTAGNTSNEDLY